MSTRTRDEASSCFGKTPYVTPSAARETVMKHSTSYKRRLLQIYRCRICGAWHYGHREPDPKPTLKQKNWTPWKEIGE